MKSTTLYLSKRFVYSDLFVNWPREKERRRLRGKNDDGDGGAR